MGPYMGPYGSSWTGLGKSVNFPSTFRSDFWTNFARFGSKNNISMKYLNDSASFLLEKLKNHVILTKNPNIWQKKPTILKKNRKYKRKTWNSKGPKWRPYVEGPLVGLEEPKECFSWRRVRIGVGASLLSCTSCGALLGATFAKGSTLATGRTVTAGPTDDPII